MCRFLLVSAIYWDCVPIVDICDCPALPKRIWTARIASAYKMKVASITGMYPPYHIMCCQEFAKHLFEAARRHVTFETDIQVESSVDESDDSTRNKQNGVFPTSGKQLVTPRGASSCDVTVQWENECEIYRHEEPLWEQQRPKYRTDAANRAE